MSKFMIGCDPEFFLHDGIKYVSAHDIIPGTKKEPYILKDGACQADGTAVEFNINPAASSEEFCYNIMSVLAQIRQMIPKKYTFRFKPSVRFPSLYFKKLPKTATELGCDPDFTISFNFSMLESTSKKELERTTMRTGSGHFHFGWRSPDNVVDENHIRDAITFIHLANKLYVPFWDKDDVRPYYYGAPSTFRPKPYGVEFRTPSNAWVQYPVLQKKLFEIYYSLYEKLMSKNNVSFPAPYTETVSGANAASQYVSNVVFSHTDLEKRISF